MKHKRLIIFAISYFALLCILYTWRSLPIYTVLAIGFIALLIVLIRQFYLLNAEHFRSKQRIFAVCLLFAVFLSTFLLPILNNYHPNRRVIVSVEYEKSGQGKAFLRLLENGTFDYDIAVGQRFEGNYKFHGDTIFFELRDKAELPQFVVLNIPAFQDSKFCGQITLYRTKNDSGTTYKIHQLSIRKSRVKE